jgi:hypothetical protein
MARFDVAAACEAYAKENEEKGGKAFDLILQKDLDLHVQWTSNTWDDGVPVTKMFRRNDTIQLSLDEGTRVRGVTYAGWSSGKPQCDFVLNGIWYSNDGAWIMEHLA